MQSLLSNSICSSVILLIVFYSNAEAELYSWTFKGQPISIQYTFDEADVNYYKNKSKREQNLAVYAEESSVHPYFSCFANTLRQKALLYQWYGNNERDMVIQFVQEAIPYKKDPFNNGYDYPRYPIETLFEMKGDCEDKSCLLVAILKTMGYDAVLLAFPDHVAVGISDDRSNGTAYKYNGKNYLYIETTSVFPLGKNPGYGKATVFVVNKTTPLVTQLPQKSIPAFTSTNSKSKSIRKPAAQISASTRPIVQKQYTNTYGRPVIKLSTTFFIPHKSVINKTDNPKSKVKK